MDSEKSKALVQLSVEAEPLGFLPFSTSFCFTTGFGRLQAAQATWSWAALELQKKKRVSPCHVTGHVTVCHVFSLCVVHLTPPIQGGVPLAMSKLCGTSQYLRERVEMGWEFRTLDCFSSQPSQPSFFGFESIGQVKILQWNLIESNQYKPGWLFCTRSIELDFLIFKPMPTIDELNHRSSKLQIGGIWLFKEN